jgi:hypothetical protein
MSNSRYGGEFPTMPPQKIALGMKGDKWREMCVDAIDGLATSVAWDGRSSKQRKQINYNLLNSKLDEGDYKHVLDPYGIGDKYGKSPARLHDINIIRQKVELLKGEEITRPFDFMIMCVSGGGVSEREEFEKDLAIKTARYQMQKEAGLNPEEPEEGMPKSLKDIQSYMENEYVNIREEYAGNVMRNGLEEQRLEFKFSEGFEHALAVAEEVYYSGIVANEPVVRVVNPLYFEWEKGPEVRNVQDAGWAREERYMTTSEIIDEYSEFLTEKQVTDLDNGLNSYGMNRNTMLPGYGYQMEDMMSYEQMDNYSDRSQTSYLRVLTVVWKSLKRIGFLRYFDEEGEEQETIVEEGHKLTPEEEEAGATIEWQYISEVWKGTKIGDDIFLDINPTENQMRTMDNPSECKLPYVGMTYNNTNSVQTSLVDLLKPHQYLYNVVWYRIENEIAKAKGKKVQIDLAQMPKSHGMTTEKWMYYFDNMGIIYINSFEEGKAGTRAQGMHANQNLVREIDLSLSNVVQQYMMILNKIEELIDGISGVSRQREGAIHQNETAGGVERAVNQSSTITEYYFHRHDEIKREVLRQYIETSKYAYAGGKKIHRITSDMQRISMEIDGEIYVDSDYNLFPTNATRDKIMKAKLEGLAPIAMQQDKANLSDLVSLYKSNSMAEYEKKLIASEKAKIARDQEMQQQAERINQANIEAQQAADEREHEQKLEELDRKGEWDVRKAVVVGSGFAEDKDMDGDGIPDISQEGERQLESARVNGEFLSRERQRGADAIKHDKELRFKRDEMASKERMNKENNKTALKNKVTGEK